MVKRVYFLANAGAGKQTAELGLLCDLLDDSGISYDLHQIKNWKQLKHQAAALQPNAYDAILVYGGDGSVLKFAHALSGGKVPLCILPGGTNNAVAHSLGQNLSATQALKALVDGRYDHTALDVGQCNNKPFVFDLHYGILATAVTQAPRALKQKIGSLAYVVTAIKHMQDLQAFDFVLKLDTQTITTQAFVCYIANSGLPTFLGVPIFGRKRAADGYLDIALVKTTNFWPLLGWFLARAWLGQGSGRAVALHRAKKITITKAPTAVFYDDTTTTIRPPLVLTVQPHSLPVLVPRKTALGQRLQSALTLLSVQFHRGLDHLRRIFTGMSAQRLSQLTDSFYIGGQPGLGGLKKLQGWGVTAVVSMRRHTPSRMPSGMKLLHLPTTDHAPIALQDLQKGIAFIDQQIEAGGKVYVHCRMGEGRAASMAIAYLVAQGMFLNDAVHFIKQRRVFINPNTRQLARLREFARGLRKHEA